MVSVSVVLTNHMPEIAVLLEDAVSRLVAAAADMIVTIAQGLAAVDTGRLRDSIVTELTGILTATAGTDVPYAVYQEFGTRFMAAHPYLIPATDQVRGIIESLFASVGGLGLR